MSFKFFLSSRWGKDRLKLAHVRLIGIAVGIPAILLSTVLLGAGANTSLVAKGPILVAHERLNCVECHVASPGTTRQQVQANLRHLLGLQDHGADLGFAAVDSSKCISCHARPNERHPIFRFREPRFKQALEQVNAESCLGCHTEHTGQLASVDIDFCQACHEDLKLNSDPLDVSHQLLISKNDWNSCLGCHDFHGNHPVKPPLVRAEAHSVSALRTYLENGSSPYSNTKTYEAKSP